MKIWLKIIKAPIRVVRIKRKSGMVKLRRKMIRVKIALSQEKAETKAMLYIYRRYTQGLASKEELKIANEQFVDVLKGVGIGVVAVLPFAPITLPVVIRLGRMVGVDILPSSFSRTDKKPEKT